MTSFDGIVLAGGSGRRLGGVAKPELLLGGVRLLDSAVAALGAARRIVVVGPVTTLPADTNVQWVREAPPGGGPVAALAAALPFVTEEIVVVLAADLPFVTSAAITQLVSAAPVIGVDDEGRDQPLLAAYSTTALRAALPAQPSGARLREVLAGQPGVPRLRLDGVPPPWWDCDTPAELQRAREWHDAARRPGSVH